MVMCAYHRFAAVIAASGFAVFATPSLAASVFYDSFELPVPDDNRWQVYQQAGDTGAWTTRSGAGIEIQTNRAIGLTDAHTGSQYVELDSDKRKGGQDQVTNSAMMTTLNLMPGKYELSWWYRARTNKVGDNKIDVYLSGDDDGPLGTLLASMNKTRSETPDWVNSKAVFHIDAVGEYDLIFGAFGENTDNTLGGFVDTVEISAVPVPASFAFLGAAIAGLGFAKRRRKTA